MLLCISYYCTYFSLPHLFSCIQRMHRKRHEVEFIIFTVMTLKICLFSRILVTFNKIGKLKLHLLYYCKKHSERKKNRKEKLQCSRQQCMLFNFYLIIKSQPLSYCCVLLTQVDHYKLKKRIYYFAVSLFLNCIWLCLFVFFIKYVNSIIYYPLLLYFFTI